MTAGAVVVQVSPTVGALVVYKGHPARVTGVADKLEVELEGGRAQRVRPKDVALLHPGPLRSLADLKAPCGEPEAAWELLAGTTTDLRELAELTFGTFTPSTAWAAWALVGEGLLFSGTPTAIRARSPEEVQLDRDRRAARVAEEQARAGFAERLRAGTCGPEDARFLADVERLADGRSEGSRLLRELGREESPESAHRLLLRVHYWDETVNPHPRRYGQAVEAPDLAVPELPQEARVDLTHLPAYAIDDDDNRDPDDALSLDGERLWVHVADVAALVSPDSPLDREARARGANLYLPERTVPMLPAAVTDRLGLGLHPTSPALSIALTPGPDGAPVVAEVVRSWVRVTRLSYGEVEQRLAEEPFVGLLDLALRYQARRLRRGALLLVLPEVKVRVEGGQVTIHPLPRLRSRDLVMEAMLMAGEAVARMALSQALPMPFATQPAPESTPEPAQGLAAMYAQRRLLRRTQFRAVPEPHAGLGLEFYTQVTSPLRRYLDLVAHQQLRAWLAGTPLLDHEQVLERVGATEAVIGPVRQAERASNRHWTLVYLQRRPGWEGTGVLVERRGTRATVLVPEIGLEAPVHLDPDLPLDSALPVTLAGVDLPSLTAHLNAAGNR